MKKIIISLSFIIAACSVSLPALAATAPTTNTFWSYSSVPPVVKGVLRDANNLPMRAAVTLNIFEPGQGAQKPIKYAVSQLTFHLTNTNGAVDTDIHLTGVAIANKNYVPDSFSLNAGMHGGALLVGNTFNITACYNSQTEQNNPFNFLDLNPPPDGSTRYSMNSGVTGVMATIANGTLIELFKKGDDTNTANVRMTFQMVGSLLDSTQSTNYPARIVVTISGTVAAPQPQ